MIRNKTGYALREAVITLIIIAVAIAIAIPFFSDILEKAKENLDIANVRAAYTEVMLTVAEGRSEAENGVVTDKDCCYKVVDLRQKKDNWQMPLPITIGGVRSETAVGEKDSDSTWIGWPEAEGRCLIYFDIKENRAYFFWSLEDKTLNIEKIKRKIKSYTKGYGGKNK